MLRALVVVGSLAQAGGAAAQEPAGPGVPGGEDPCAEGDFRCLAAEVRATRIAATKLAEQAAENVRDLRTVRMAAAAGDARDPILAEILKDLEPRLARIEAALVDRR